MTTITIEVADRDTTNRRFTAAMKGQAQGEFLSFDSPTLLFQVLNARRWTILDHLQKQGPLRLRALARELGMDAGNLARDIKPLKSYGLIEDSADGLRVPYDAIEVRLALGRAA